MPIFYPPTRVKSYASHESHGTRVPEYYYDDRRAERGWTGRGKHQTTRTGSTHEMQHESRGARPDGVLMVMDGFPFNLGACNCFHHLFPSRDSVRISTVRGEGEYDHLPEPRLPSIQIIPVRSRLLSSFACSRPFALHLHSHSACLSSRSIAHTVVGMNVCMCWCDSGAHHGLISPLAGLSRRNSASPGLLFSCQPDSHHESVHVRLHPAARCCRRMVRTRTHPHASRTRRGPQATRSIFFNSLQPASGTLTPTPNRSFLLGYLVATDFSSYLCLSGLCRSSPRAVHRSWACSRTPRSDHSLFAPSTPPSE